MSQKGSGWKGRTKNELHHGSQGKEQFLKRMSLPYANVQKDQGE